MPTVYDPPYDLRVHSAQTPEKYRQYIEALRARALYKPHLREPLDPIVGEVIRIDHALGQAAFIVWSAKPFSLVRIKLPGVVAMPFGQESSLTLTAARKQHAARLARERREQRANPKAWTRPPVQLTFASVDQQASAAHRI